MLELIITFVLALAPALAQQQAPAQQQQKQPAPRAEVRSPHGTLARPCEDCHTFTSWKPIRGMPEFNHNKDTRFPLIGMHANVTCTQCHTSMVFSKVGNTCGDCHADLHRGQFGTNCEKCHSEKGWQVSIQDISQHFNRFPLTGPHAMLQCDSCHRNAASGQFTGLSTDCYSCHQKDYVSTSVIDHRALGFPPTCLDCHTIDTWANAQFDHLKFTGYALTGMHATLPCASCHAGGRFKGTPATCIGCHQKDFTGTNNPPHVSAGFPTDCGLCHTTSAWTPATFDHTTFTKFPLTGAHQNVPCASCHQGGNFTNAPTTCYGCHQADFTNPKNTLNHVTAGLPTDCTMCHTTTAWLPSSFNHNTPPFPLTGAHLSVACATCHVSGNYTTLPTTCYGCHQADFTNPKNTLNHVAAGLPTDCTVCHSTTAWLPASFNHNNTPFPLTGAHVSVPCATCHVGGNYTTVATTCIGCHQADFTLASGPTSPLNHTGFPTDCAMCHDTTLWTDAVFNHNNTPFPLLGAHVNVACANCHTTSNFASTPTDCYSCHATDYNNTSNPNHRSAGFPTTCVTCHTTWVTTNWLGAVFNHTWFPLTHGNSNGVCSTCHTTASNYAVFSCINGCHSQANTDGEHRGVSGYTYGPMTCYACHRNGGGG